MDRAAFKFVSLSYTRNLTYSVTIKWFFELAEWLFTYREQTVKHKPFQTTVTFSYGIKNKQVQITKKCYTQTLLTLPVIFHGSSHFFFFFGIYYYN